MTVLAAFALSAAVSASAGVDLATGSLDGILLDTATSGSPIVLGSASEVSALSEVTYRKGETVTATKHDGTSLTLVEGAAASGSVVFAPDAGGLWRLENSNGETALFGVAWSVYGDSWSRNFAFGSPLKMDTNGIGPNRSVKSRNAPPLAYTGDHWRGDASANATLTFAPPGGGAATELQLTGSGSTLFHFNKPGLWAVTLLMADSTELFASIDIASIGSMLIVY